MNCSNSKDVGHIVSNFHVLSKDPSASTSSGALWALQVARRTRSLDLHVCVTFQDTIFENRQRVNKTACTVTKRFKTVCVQQCTNQNRKIKPAPIMGIKNGSGKLCKPHHAIMQRSFN
ncbi:hypothetical protein DPMN_114519 [Dreissena polymorpha]|uniref:Uncharacterized protein n=1 Tax=Dreissena polymorpha TaxID=45954 RepID=A0A9D4KL33_DREPO|nr:hypothetical protein DPMN_114519 [Dreissena polymorpha]